MGLPPGHPGGTTPSAERCGATAISSDVQLLRGMPPISLAQALGLAVRALGYESGKELSCVGDDAREGCIGTTKALSLTCGGERRSDHCCSIGSVPVARTGFESSAASTRANPPSRANAAVKCSRMQCRRPALTAGPALFVYPRLCMGVVRRLLVSWPRGNGARCTHESFTRN